MGGQGVRRRHRVHRHGGVGRVRDRLGEHQVRVGVDAPARGGGCSGRMEAVEERIYWAGVGVAERRGTDGILRTRGRQGTVLGHQRLDGEAALGRRLKHAAPRSGRPGLPAPGDRSALPSLPAARGEDRRELGTRLFGVGVGVGGKERKERKEERKERKKERRGEGEERQNRRSRESCTKRAQPGERGEKILPEEFAGVDWGNIFLSEMAWGGDWS